MNKITEEELDEELATLFGDTNHKQKIKNIVLSGGGIKGIAHVGAISALYKLNLIDNLETLIGTSIGAIVCLLLSIGYTWHDLLNIISEMPLSEINQIKFENIFKNFGIDNGRNMEAIIQKLFVEKGFPSNTTFLQHFEKTNKVVIFSTCCLNNKKAYYLSKDTCPKLPVLLGLRMSYSIPFYYTPIKIKNKYYIDGGCIDNLPIHLIKNKLNESVGIYLSDIRDNIDNFQNIEEVFISVLQCLLEGGTKNSIRGYEDHIIRIDLEKHCAINLQINHDNIQKMFMTGYNATMKYFS